MPNVISIVIPTYKREESLSNLLKNLIRVVDRNTEVIVVEQEEYHGEKYKKLARRLDLSFQYFFQSRRSTPRAMNMGVSKAKGKYILFLDDDVLPKPSFVSAHLKNFEDLKVAATVGRVVTDGQKVDPARRDTGRVNWLGLFSDGFSSMIKQEVDTVIGCNTCWRKDVYQKLGGIDERFTGNALRLESDLSLLAKRAGYKIIFEPKAEARHLRVPIGGARKTNGRIQWYFDFFSNETYFFLKHRATILLPIFLFLKVNWVFKCMFGFGREVSIRSITTPIIGVIDGIRKYKDWIPAQRPG